MLRDLRFDVSQRACLCAQQEATARHSLVGLDPLEHTDGLGWLDPDVWSAREYLGTTSRHRSTLRFRAKLVYASSFAENTRGGCGVNFIYQTGSATEQEGAVYPTGI